MKEIDAAGGVETEIKKIGSLDRRFRERIKELPFEIVSESMSNAVTPLHPLTASANDIFLTLKDELWYLGMPEWRGIERCNISGRTYRHLTTEDNDKLIDAIERYAEED